MLDVLQAVTHFIVIVGGTAGVSKHEFPTKGEPDDAWQSSPDLAAGTKPRGLKES
jgi:hypothetical protein